MAPVPVTVDRAQLLAWRRYHLRQAGEIEKLLGLPLTSHEAGRRHD